ncbi:MAG: homoserine dehydrogenase [Caldilineaceae bacterium]|nr:homoserine dehydrogenase [Caldilineaceae bacterium]
MTKTIRTALIGLGHVGRGFLRILEEKEGRLAGEYGLRFQVVCVADSSGVAIHAAGFDPAALRRHKLGGGRVADLPDYQAGISPAAALAEIACDLLLEASPVNLKTGEPGLSVTRAALARGIHTVLANKAPLVLAFRELHQIAAANRAGLAFSATVCGALPVINIGRRDLIAADITRLRGIFNSTSNFILEEMTAGRSYADALAEAQRRGIAEADPSLDVEGWDTANKLVIIANSFLGVEAKLSDVTVQGITAITQADLDHYASIHQHIKLVAEAVRTGDGYILSVRPQPLPIEDFLAACRSWEMGIEIHSDLYEIMYHKIWEAEPLPTAAAMLRDAVNLMKDHKVKG